MTRFTVPALVGLLVLLVLILFQGVHIGSVTHDPKRLKSCRYLQLFWIKTVPALNDEKCSWFLK